MTKSAAKQPIRPDSPQERERQRRVRKTSPRVTLLLFPLSLLLRALLFTLRIKIPAEDLDAVKKCGANSLIIIFWHNRLLIATELRRRFRPHTKMNGLVSPSGDGAILATFFGFFKIGAIRGSTSRRGGPAMMEIYHRLSHGEDVAITPDGPRGPCYKFNPGATLLAQKTHCSVVLVGSKYSHAIRLKSWDRFMIPLPFSKVELSVKVFHYEKAWDELTPQELAERFERELRAMSPD